MKPDTGISSTSPFIVEHVFYDMIFPGTYPEKVVLKRKRFSLESKSLTYCPVVQQRVPKGFSIGGVGVVDYNWRRGERYHADSKNRDSRNYYGFVHYRTFAPPSKPTDQG
jgi:hypothetical protein